MNHSEKRRVLFNKQKKLIPTIVPSQLRHVVVAAKDGRTGRDIQLYYTYEKVVGNGSFGVVYQAKLMPIEEKVAIKRVLQDRRFKVKRRKGGGDKVKSNQGLNETIESRVGDDEINAPSKCVWFKCLLL